MMFVLLYGRNGLFAPLIAKAGFQVVFAFPGACVCAGRVCGAGVRAERWGKAPKRAQLMLLTALMRSRQLCEHLCAQHQSL